MFFFKRCWESWGVAVIFFKILNSPPKRSRAQPVARRKIENTTGQQSPKLLHLGEWKMGVHGSYKDSFRFLKLFHSISFNLGRVNPGGNLAMKRETATGHAAVGSWGFQSTSLFAHRWTSREGRNWQVGRLSTEPKGDRLRDCVQTSHFSRGYDRAMLQFFRNSSIPGVFQGYRINSDSNDTNLLMETIPADVTCVTYLQGHWWRCSNDRKVPGNGIFGMIERAFFSCMTWKIHWIYWIYPPVIVATVLFLPRGSATEECKNWLAFWVGGDRSKICSCLEQNALLVNALPYFQKLGT